MLEIAPISLINWARDANYHYISMYGCQSIDQIFWALDYIRSFVPLVYFVQSRSLLEKYENCNIQPALHFEVAYRYLHLRPVLSLYSKPNSEREDRS
jgi:hypothetical protein